MRKSLSDAGFVVPRFLGGLERACHLKEMQNKHRSFTLILMQCKRLIFKVELQVSRWFLFFRPRSRMGIATRGSDKRWEGFYEKFELKHVEVADRQQNVLLDLREPEVIGRSRMEPEVIGRRTKLAEGSSVRQPTMS